MVEDLPNAPSTTPNWQQYLVLNLQDDNTLFVFIDNWEGTVPAGTDNEIINDLVPMTTLATNNEIPAGAIVNIAPTFSSTNVITGVTFMYTPPGGKTVSTSITLTDLDVFGTLENVTSAYESPISAFTLNIVGDLDGSNGVFTSGSGTIVYKADQPLTVLSTEPSYTSFQDGTGETANTVYGELPVSNSTTITQTWGLSAAGAPSLGLGIGHKLRIAPSSKQKGRRSLPISRHIVRMNKGNSAKTPFWFKS